MINKRDSSNKKVEVNNKILNLKILINFMVMMYATFVLVHFGVLCTPTSWKRGRYKMFHLEMSLCTLQQELWSLQRSLEDFTKCPILFKSYPSCLHIMAERALQIVSFEKLGLHLSLDLERQEQTHCRRPPLFSSWTAIPI